MIQTYSKGEIEILRNFNKRGGKFFYVIYKKHKTNFTRDIWIGRIFFSKFFADWVMEFENEKAPKHLTIAERNYCFKILDTIRRDHGK